MLLFWLQKFNVSFEIVVAAKVSILFGIFSVSQVAPNAVNVAGAQFHDLVRLSVDEAAIVQAEEEAINASRKKANASVLRPR